MDNDFKRYSPPQAREILTRFGQLTEPEIAAKFSGGREFLYGEIAGQTLGEFVAWQPRNPWWVRLAVSFFFNSFYGRWTGKEFTHQFGVNRQGQGRNLFANRFGPRRYKFDTYIKPAYLDSQPCVVLDYRPYRSIMFGLFDDLRKVEDGVFLGQMWYKFPFSSRPVLLGYFGLCALDQKLLKR